MGEGELGAPDGVVPSKVPDGAPPLGRRPIGVLDLVQVHEGEEQVREELEISLQPVQADERLVHVAPLVFARAAPGRDARQAVRGGLHEGAQGIPQGVPDGLVVDRVRACGRPDRNPRPDVIRQGGTKGLLPSALGDLAVPKHEVLLGLPVAEGERRAFDLMQGAPLASCGKMSLVTVCAILTQSKSRNLWTWCPP